MVSSKKEGSHSLQAVNMAQVAARVQCTPPPANVHGLGPWRPAHPPTHMPSTEGPSAQPPVAGVPIGLEQPLRQMVAPVAEARPPAAAFPGCAFFQSDVLLRALKVIHVYLCP